MKHHVNRDSENQDHAWMAYIELTQERTAMTGARDWPSVFAHDQAWVAAMQEPAEDFELGGEG